MPMDHLLFKTAWWRQLAGRDVHGQPGYAAAAAVKLRFENIDRELKLSPEQTVHLTGRAFIAGSSGVQNNDQLQIEGVKYRVVKTERTRMIDGKIDHVEALLSEEA